MGKLASIILGTICVLGVSYYIMSQAFSPITNWFGPIAGYKLTLLLGLMFLFAGNPIHHPILIPAWAIIASVIAVLSRKILRAILSAMIVYTLSLIFAVMAVASVLFQFIPPSMPSAGSSPTIPGAGAFSPFSMLPPTPPGSDIISILNEPVISTFVKGVMSFFSTHTSQSFSGLGPTSIMNQFSFLDPLILHIAENSIIFIFLTGLFAYLIREGIGRFSTGGVGSSVAPKAIAFFIVASLLMTVLMCHPVAGSAGPSSIGDMIAAGSFPAVTDNTKTNAGASNPAVCLSYLNDLSGLLSAYYGYAMLPRFQTPSGTSSSLRVAATGALNMSNHSAGSMYANLTWTKESYVELNAAFASASGNSNDLYLFARGTGQPANTNSSLWYSGRPVADSLFTAVIGSSGLPNFFLNSNLSTFSAGGFSPGFAYSNAIPSLLIVVVFLGNTTSTSVEASTEITYLSQTLHIPTPTLALNLGRNVSVNGTTTSVSVYIYGGAYNFARISAGYVNGMVSGFGSSGLIVPFADMIKSGYFVPSASPDSVNGSLILAAYASHPGLSLLPNQVSSLFGNSTGSPGIALLAGLGVRNTVFNSSQTGNITLSSLTGYSKTINFEADSNLSVLAVGAPSNMTNTSAGAVFSGIGFKIYASNVSYRSGFGMVPQNSSDIYFVNGTGMNPADISIRASTTFPADLRVKTNVIREGSYEKVSTLIYNNGREPINNMIVNESSLQEYYGVSITTISGSPNAIYQALQPQQSVTLSYKIELKGVGLYLLPPLISISYQLMQKSFSMTYSPSKYYRSANPDVFCASNSVIESFLHGLSRFVTSLSILAQPIAGDFYVFDIIIILFFILAFYIEYRAFSKWNKLRHSGSKRLE
ncbi:MAG: hypothetical protein KIY11_09170 [Thermoplasmata archaeon]|nr:hypothetical protein [Candidatus Sysuiplasma acidicola]